MLRLVDHVDRHVGAGSCALPQVEVPFHSLMARLLIFVILIEESVMLRTFLTSSQAAPMGQRRFNV